jgi:hypothetical protein
VLLGRMVEGGIHGTGLPIEVFVGLGVGDDQDICVCGI